MAEDALPALLYAAEHGRVDVINQLLASEEAEGLDPAAQRPEDGATALHLAVSAGSVDAVRALLRCAPQAVTLKGWAGVYEGRLPIHGASEAVRAAFVMEAIQLAAADNVDGVARLLDGGLSPDELTDGQALLHWAVSMGSIGVASLLLERGAQLELRCPDTPLRVAAAKGHAAIVELLLGAGADIDAVAADWGSSDEGAFATTKAVADVLARHLQPSPSPRPPPVDAEQALSKALRTIEERDVLIGNLRTTLMKALEERDVAESLLQGKGVVDHIRRLKDEAEEAWARVGELEEELERVRAAPPRPPVVVSAPLPPPTPPPAAVPPMPQLSPVRPPRPFDTPPGTPLTEIPLSPAVRAPAPAPAPAPVADPLPEPVAEPKSYGYFAWLWPSWWMDTAEEQRPPPAVAATGEMDIMLV